MNRLQGVKNQEEKEDEQVQIFVRLFSETITYNLSLTELVEKIVPCRMSLFLKTGATKIQLDPRARLGESGVRNESTCVAEFSPEDVCPLTLTPFSDPVFSSTLQMYEREAIEQWLSRDNNVDPLTRQALTCSDLFPPTLAARVYGVLEVRFYVNPQSEAEWLAPITKKVFVDVNSHQSVGSVKHEIAKAILRDADIRKDAFFITTNLSVNSMTLVHRLRTFRSDTNDRPLFSVGIPVDDVCLLVFSKMYEHS
jgi:hypothetical protein